ncbi:MAG TPA: TetR family transcriptional regulator [Candidatus Saccharimonadales bacterium]|nr:TetR family transcriptional regulator [Candidatus Saccharimonadales bacterium]
MSRTGRRPGAPRTREDILLVARRSFGARGYDATSLRSIARQADVDPALLIHYFGTKDALFVAALEVTMGPSAMFGGLANETIAEAAQLIVRRYLLMLDHEQTRDVVLGLVRSAVSSERAATMLREFLSQNVTSFLRPLIAHPDAELRASLLVAQLIGIAMLRHVVKAEAVASASNEDLVSRVAPVIEAYLR